MELSNKRERCQGCGAQRLPLTKAKRKACFFRCDSSHRLPSGERGEWGEAPYKISIALTFFLRYGGALRHPPIVMNSVDFINRCLLFIFFNKSIDISFLLCYYIDIKERTCLYGKYQKPTNKKQVLLRIALS